MAYDLEEQEQLETLKAFWKQWGNLLMTVVTTVLVVIAGYRMWGWHQARQAGQAAVVYGQLEQAAAAKDVGKVKEAAGSIFADYGKTAYAQMAALLAAKTYFDAGDLKSARLPLQWAMDNAQDAEFRQVARLRLAGVLLDDKAYDEALALVAGDAPGRFGALYAERRGDILLAQDKRAEARAAYKQALDALDAANPVRPIVQLKFDALAELGS